MSTRLILLLVLCVHLITSAAILAKRAFDQEEFIERFNENRLQYAKQHNIGNMHELSYDSGLERIAKEMAKGCEFKHGKYVFISYEDMLVKMKEMYHPLQTRIACVEMVAPCPARNVNEGFCLLGPNADGFSDDLFKTGPLGSHCNGKVADNGLCKGGSGSSKTSKTSKTSGSLNKLRRQYAIQHNVGNMHELSYNSGLEKIAKEMAKGCEFEHGNYVFISNEQMFDKSKEVLHPLQTQIACVDMLAPCPARNVEHGFCLLGPHSDGFSEKLLKTGPLGSHCNGEIADNGLCKASSGSDQKKLIENLNKLRRQYAIQHNVGNMHELSYDTGLEKIAKDMSKGCDFDHGKYVFISYEQIFEKMNEIYHPLQTRIACVEMVAPCPARNVHEGFCLLGPHADGFSEKLLKTGPLGSNCDHGFADNGLCKA